MDGKDEILNIVDVIINKETASSNNERTEIMYINKTLQIISKYSFLLARGKWYILWDIIKKIRFWDQNLTCIFEKKKKPKIWVPSFGMPNSQWAISEINCTVVGIQSKWKMLIQ